MLHIKSIYKNIHHRYQYEICLSYAHSLIYLTSFAEKPNRIICVVVTIIVLRCGASVRAANKNTEKNIACHLWEKVRQKYVINNLNFIRVRIMEDKYCCNCLSIDYYTESFCFGLKHFNSSSRNPTVLMIIIPPAK